VRLGSLTQDLAAGMQAVQQAEAPSSRRSRHFKLGRQARPVIRLVHADHRKILETLRRRIAALQRRPLE
jgi:hypothetical protein